MAIQIWDTDQVNYMGKGKVHQNILRSQIDEALNNNIFNGNFIISSLPGLGKSFEMEQALSKLATKPLIFQGVSSMAAFTIEVATAVYLSRGQHLVVVLDDCDVLFDSKNINITKKMFDDTRKLIYGKNYRGLQHLCSELQFEAISSFGSEERAGFAVPLDNVTFIVLTNRHLSNVDEAEDGNDFSTDSYAIRRRTEYKEIEMATLELWGYVANVVLNEKICEKFIPDIELEYKNQILTWCYNNWTQVTERNLSLVEKMTKDIKRYPTSYPDIWKSNYIVQPKTAKKGKK